MKTLSKFEVEHLIGDLKQGNIIPINVGNYSNREQLFLSYNKETGLFNIFGELTGLIDITENNIYLNLLEYKYFIGYSRALDMAGTEVRKGDFVVLPFNNEIGVVKDIIVEADELMEKCTESTDYKSFYKYYHILKPIAVIEITHHIGEGEHTRVTELQHVKPESEIKEVRTERIITKNTRCFYNVKSYEKEKVTL